MRLAIIQPTRPRLSRTSHQSSIGGGAGGAVGAGGVSSSAAGSGFSIHSGGGGGGAGLKLTAGEFFSAACSFAAFSSAALDFAAAFFAKVPEDTLANEDAEPEACGPAALGTEAR